MTSDVIIVICKLYLKLYLYVNHKRHKKFYIKINHSEQITKRSFMYVCVYIYNIFVYNLY